MAIFGVKIQIIFEFSRQKFKLQVGICFLVAKRVKGGKVKAIAITGKERQ